MLDVADHEPGAVREGARRAREGERAGAQGEELEEVASAHRDSLHLGGAPVECEPGSARAVRVLRRPSALSVGLNSGYSSGMPRRERRGKGGCAEELVALLESGDHRGARELARAVLAKASVPGVDQEAARSALARVSPDRAARWVALAGLTLIAGLALWLVLRT
jgi:hypothetical protein